MKERREQRREGGRKEKREEWQEGRRKRRREFTWKYLRLKGSSKKSLVRPLKSTQDNVAYQINLT